MMKHTNMSISALKQANKQTSNLYQLMLAVYMIADIMWARETMARTFRVTIEHSIIKLLKN